MTPCVLVSGDFVTTGGMDRANYALADHLSAAGHEVHLVAHRVAPELSERAGVVVHRIPKPAGSYLLGSPLLDGAGRMWVRRVLRRRGAALVNGGNCLAPAVNWVHYVHAAYTPTLVGGALRRAKATRAHSRALRRERGALELAPLVVVNSRRTARDVIERVGVPEERVRVVYYGIDASRFQPPTDAVRSAARSALGWSEARRRAVFVGALGDRRKGFDALFTAWSQLRSSDWDLVVVGRGQELRPWRQRAADSGLGGRIQFLGFRDDVPRVLAACDLLVAPTRYEAYGLGVHEALCMGVPALVSADAGVAERYPEGSSALLLPPGADPATLGERLEAVMADLETCREQVALLSAELRARTWRVMAEELGALLEEVRGQGVSRAPR